MKEQLSVSINVDYPPDSQNPDEKLLYALISNRMAVYGYELKNRSFQKADITREQLLIDVKEVLDYTKKFFPALNMKIKSIFIILDVESEDIKDIILG